MTDDDHYACDPDECDEAVTDPADDHYACDPDECPHAVQDSTVGEPDA